MFGLRMLRAVRQGRTQDVAMLGVMVPMKQTPGIPTLRWLPVMELYSPDLCYHHTQSIWPNSEGNSML